MSAFHAYHQNSYVMSGMELQASYCTFVRTLVKLSNS